MGGNLDQDDPDAVGGPRSTSGCRQAQGSAAGSPDDRDPGRGQLGVLARTFRIWIQIIAERPAWSALCPETSSNPWPRKNTTLGILRGATPGRGQAKYIAIEAAAAVQVAGPQRDPAAQNVHATISASR